MTPAEVVELMAYHAVSTGRVHEPVPSMEAVWTGVLAQVDPDDAREALDMLLERGEFITPQRVAGVAREVRRVHANELPGGRYAAPVRELPGVPQPLLPDHAPVDDR